MVSVPGHPHAPAWQACPEAQVTPHEPQCDTLVDRSTQAPPQSDLPAAHPASAVAATVASGSSIGLEPLPAFAADELDPAGEPPEAGAPEDPPPEEAGLIVGPVPPDAPVPEDPMLDAAPPPELPPAGGVAVAPPPPEEQPIKQSEARTAAPSVASGLRARALEVANRRPGRSKAKREFSTRMPVTKSQDPLPCKTKRVASRPRRAPSGKVCCHHSRPGVDVRYGATGKGRGFARRLCNSGAAGLSSSAHRIEEPTTPTAPPAARTRPRAAALRRGRRRVLRSLCAGIAV